MKAAARAFFLTIKENLKSPQLMIMMLIFPIVLILILGTALSGYFKESNIPKIHLLYVENNQSLKYFRSTLENDKTFSKLFELTTVKTLNEAVKILKTSNKYIAIVYLKEKTTKDIQDHSYFGNFDIEIIAKENSIYSSLTKAFFNIFTNYYKSAQSVDALYSIPKQIEFLSAFSKKLPSALDYYAVTMLVMITLYGAFGGIAVIEDERRQNTMVRLFASPENPQKIFLAKAFAQVLFLYAQLITIVLFSKYVYNANWGEHLEIIFLLLFIYSIFAILFGIFIELVTRSFMLSNIIIGSFAVASTFLIGGYYTISIKSPWLIFIRNMLPNYIVQSGIFTIIYNPSEVFYIQKVFSYLIILCMVLGLISLILLRKVKVWQFSE